MLGVVANLFAAALLSSIMVGVTSPIITFSESLMAGFSLIHGVLAGGLLATYLYYVLGIGVPVELITLLYVVIIAIIVGELTERGYSTDSASAISSAISGVITVLFAYLSGPYSTRAWSIVVGSSIIVSRSEIIFLAIFLALSLIIVLIFGKEALYISFDREGAYVLGYNVKLYKYAIYVLIALVVVSLTYTLGIIVTHILLPVPGALALSLKRKNYLVTSTITAVFIGSAGYFLSYIINLPPSVGVGAVALAVFLINESIKRGKK